MDDIERNLCASCSKPFKARSQSPRQAYCAKVECQRERRRRWQRAKRLIDPDYKSNQRNAQRAWLGRHPNYWAEYRRTHPEYCELNRCRQRTRNRAKARTVLIKITAIHLSGALTPGLYRLTPIRNRIANSNSSGTDIRWVSALVGVLREHCKETI